jgi:hypothetical protein
VKDKRPMVFVPRKLMHFTKTDCLSGYYVSKAYVNFVGKTYNKDGSITKEYLVDFVNELELLDITDEYLSDIANNISMTEIFASFDDCKKFVDEQNSLLYANGDPCIKKARQMILSKINYYGAKLEEQYISPEERIITTPPSTNDKENFIK